MSVKIPWYHQGMTSQSNPFSTFGTDYCPRCKMECETDMDCVTDCSTLAYKKTCKRCGKVICAGLYDQIAFLSDTPLPSAAFEWVRTPGRDRR